MSTSKDRKSLSWARRFLRLGLVLICLLIVGSMLAGMWAERRLTDAEAAVGFSLEIDELLPLLEDGETNGSFVLGSISNLLSAGAPHPQIQDWKNVDLAQSCGDSEKLEDARRLLEDPTYRLVLETLDLHSNVQRASAWTPGETWEVGVLESNYVSRRGQVLKLRTLLRVRALIRLAEGNVDAAYGDAELLLRVGRWMQTESPSLVSWLVGIQVADNGLHLLEEIFQIAPPSESAKARLQASITALEDIPITLGLEGELARAHQEMRRGLPFLGQKRHRLSRIFLGWFGDAVNAEYLKIGGRVIAIAEQPPHSRAQPTELTDNLAPWAVPARIMVPNFYAAMEKADILRLRLEMAGTALEWPESGQPESGLPTDPFRGESLILSESDEHQLLYSVGPNGVDEGGAIEEGTGSDSDADDIVWRLPTQERSVCPPD